VRLALEVGYRGLECALLAASDPGSGEDDCWRRNDPPPIPAMSVDQAFQLLWLHDRGVRQGWDAPHRKKRRHEPWETYTERLRAMWTAEKAREAEDDALRRALSDETEAQARAAARWEPLPPVLPALDQVRPGKPRSAMRTRPDG